MDWDHSKPRPIAIPKEQCSQTRHIERVKADARRLLEKHVLSYRSCAVATAFSPLGLIICVYCNWGNAGQRNERTFSLVAFRHPRALSISLKTAVLLPHQLCSLVGERRCIAIMRLKYDCRLAFHRQPSLCAEIDKLVHFSLCIKVKVATVNTFDFELSRVKVVVREMDGSSLFQVGELARMSPAMR